MIYLDNSATTYPKPQIVRRAVVKAMESYGANPGRGGYKMAAATDEAVYSVRKKLAAFFGSRPENVIFFSSCTAAINQVLFGKLRRGDHVLISDMEHNAVIRPLEALKAQGVEYTVAETFPGDNDRTLESFRSAMRSSTKLIVVTGASNVWGLRLPVERLAALAHIYGAEICVDAAQAAGTVPMDIGRTPIDYLCFPAHKGLYGLMGLGVLITDKASSLRPLIYGGTGSDSHSPHQPEDGPERFESGTLNVPGVMALGAGLDFVRQRGVDALRRQELRLLSYLWRQLQDISRMECFTCEPADPYCVPVLSFSAGEKTHELGEYLGSHAVAVRCGYHCAPSAHRKMGTSFGTVRVSPSAFTTSSEIEALVALLRKFR